MSTNLQSILDAHFKLTGRESKLPIYEHALFDFVRAGFTDEDMVAVITFLIRENKRNHFQYSLKLGHLINDHMRFNDLLQEAKARDRNRRPALSQKEIALRQLRPTTGEDTVTGTGAALSVKDILNRITP